MDFVNKAFAQLSELFGSLTPGARIIAGLLLAMVVVSVGFLFKNPLGGPDAYLMGGQSFTAGELPAMEAAFAKANLSGYELEGARIRVPRGQQAAYMGALADAGALPANFGDYLLKAVSDSNPFLTGPQREEMLKAARQQELAAIIRSMPGIEQAAVMFDTQTTTGLRRQKQTTASVSVKPRGIAPLEENRVPMIRHLVAGALAIAPQQVTVIDVNGQTYPGDAAGAGSGLDDPYLAKQRKYQELLVSELSRALNYVPGVTVVANVELDREQEHVDEKVKVDPKPVAVSVREESSNTESERGAPGGRVGLAAQQPNQPANLAAASQPNRSIEERSTSETQSAVGHESSRISYYPGTPKRITVSIGVPDSYFLKVYRNRNPSADGEEAAPDPAALARLEQEETTKIRSHVAGLIPLPAGAPDAQSLVTVTAFAHLPSAEIPAPELTDQALAWFGANWSTLGTIGLGLFGLLMLRSMIRSPVGEPTSHDALVSLPFPQRSSSPAPTAEPAAEAGLKRRSAQPTLRDQLAEMVRDDPATAADILRNWIGNAS